MTANYILTPAKQTGWMQTAQDLLNCRGVFTIMDVASVLPMAMPKSINGWILGILDRLFMSTIIFIGRISRSLAPLPPIWHGWHWACRTNKRGDGAAQKRASLSDILNAPRPALTRAGI